MKPITEYAALWCCIVLSKMGYAKARAAVAEYKAANAEAAQLRERLSRTTAPRYLLCPGTVRSRIDGDVHRISASQLAALYGVRMDECFVLADPRFYSFLNEQLLARVARGELIALRPRQNGNYSLPQPGARP